MTLRKLFETYANIRPARQMPGVPTRYAGEGVDFIVVRENIEDLYAGVEYLETRDVAVALKIISRKGSEKIIRYAFELARREGREHGHRGHQGEHPQADRGDVQAHRRGGRAEYPEITHQHLIIDNVAHQMVKDPAQFDIIVTTNLAGDIISDLASGSWAASASPPRATTATTWPSSRRSTGSAPKYAGKNVINPTALILSSVMMLRHLGEQDAAQRVENAVSVTLAEGEAVTLDVARQQGDVEQSTSTSGFADAVIANLGRGPGQAFTRQRDIPAVAPEPRARWSYARADAPSRPRPSGSTCTSRAMSPEALASIFEHRRGPDFHLAAVTSRGTIACPAGRPASIAWAGGARGSWPP